MADQNTPMTDDEWDAHLGDLLSAMDDDEVHALGVLAEAMHHEASTGGTDVGRSEVARSRFSELSARLRAKGAHDPDALAAFIGRKKYGVAGFKALAAAGRRRHHAGRSDTFETSGAMFLRSFPLDGIEILSRAKGGDGRTVEAYAAVFDVPTEIHDEHGHYTERIARSAFDRTLNGNAGARALCLYNHGMDLDGRPLAAAQVPLGTPLEIRADGHGLRTVTRYNRSEFADQVLESIKNEDIRAQSFRGRIYRSNPQRIPRVRPGQPLPEVTRTELGLRDYGPTPIPFYKDAAITAVRSAAGIIQDIAGLDEAERAELIRMLDPTRAGDPGSATATPAGAGLGAEDPRTAHSGRLMVARNRLRAELIRKGILTHG
jgi:HK97 family phage prohead protease